MITMIPKIIHYCWFGGNPFDEKTKKCIESWKKYCPDYEIIEWNEQNFDIENSCDYVKEAYEAKKWAFVSDYVRLYAMYHNGGIYMDTDVELLKNIDAFLNNVAFSGFEDGSNIPTAIMGSEQHGEWIRYLLSYYDDKHFIKGNGKYDMTTNVVTITNMTSEKYNIRLDNTYQNIDGIFTLYPKDYFCPKDYQSGEIKITENTVCIHHFGGSWKNKYERILTQKKNYYVEKYGENGKEKYEKWAKRNRYIIYIKAYGLKGIIDGVKRKIFRR